MTTTITGTAAIDFATRTGAQLFKHADPTDGAREITVDEARAIAREDVGLVWCKRTMTATEQGEHDAEQRAYEALAAGADGCEWQSEDDATSGWGDYAATAASHLDVPESERAAWCDAYETAARETARRMYREAQSWSTWRASTVDTITHRDIVDGTTVTTAYNDIAPVYGESRAYAALDADEREWWDATLTRMHAVAVAAARLPAKVRDRVIHAGDDGDLESAIGAQERALVEETERGAAVFGCDESDLRIVERAEAPDAGF